jgi:hypothetical protein
MTEQEWLTATDPEPMLQWLDGKASDRKLRLFACECCRRIWPRLVGRGLRKAVETSERFADGYATYSDLSWDSETAWFTHYGRADTEVDERDAAAVESDDAESYATEAAAQASCNPAEDGTAYVFRAMDTARCSADAAGSVVTELMMLTKRSFGAHGGRRAAWTHGRDEERREQAKLLRDIIPYPLRPAVMEPSWLTATVVAIARGIYDDRAFDRLPILADALMDAGCEVPEVLDHCRGEGPHVRGCWVVDAVLGKT